MLLAAAFCFGRPGTALAHDPGLSALEVRVAPSRIVVTLSLAATDAQTLIGAGRENLDAPALDSIELRLDGDRLPGIVESREIDAETGTSIVLTFNRMAGYRLTIRSGIPARIALGHRQLLTIRGVDGQLLAERMLDARENEYELDLRLRERGADIAGQFLALGVRHVLDGYDHLLFLGALLLGVRRLGDAVKTVTAFTAAHSLTLALAALGFVRAPAAIVEPMIAASIVYVGLGNLLQQQLDSRWKLTFAFGLIHGFGFAGALQELGVGTRGTGIVTPLGSFNAGVEVSQIGVAMLLWPLIRCLNARPALRVCVVPVCSVLVVAAGTYWLVERTLR